MIEGGIYESNRGEAGKAKGMVGIRIESPKEGRNLVGPSIVGDIEQLIQYQDFAVLYFLCRNQTGNGYGIVIQNEFQKYVV